VFGRNGYDHLITPSIPWKGYARGCANYVGTPSYPLKVGKDNDIGNSGKGIRCIRALWICLCVALCFLEKLDDENLSCGVSNWGLSIGLWIGDWLPHSSWPCNWLYWMFVSHNNDILFDFFLSGMVTN
jgi:hypothetical protein